MFNLALPTTAPSFKRIVFGHFGDLIGRKKTLVIALMLMGISSTLIGLLPTYDTIGIVAPIGLAINPAAKVIKDKTNAVVGSTSPKKSFGNTKPAAAPYKKKSYHSILVPDKDVKATFLILDSFCVLLII